MATNTAGTVARDLGFQAVHYLRKDFTFADLGAADAVCVVGIIPAGALILRSTLVVTVAFNDTNGDDLDIGFTAGGAELGSAMDMNAAAIDEGDIAAADVILALTTDKTVYLASTTAASDDGTTGTGYVIVEYIVT